jgi:hypothetical protein
VTRSAGDLAVALAARNMNGASADPGSYLSCALIILRTDAVL